MALPFVDQVWQIYLLIALLQSASAAFADLQATIRISCRRRTTRALSLSRLAYDLKTYRPGARRAAGRPVRIPLAVRRQGVSWHPPHWSVGVAAAQVIRRRRKAPRRGGIRII
jgi:hypothetical protein